MVHFGSAVVAAHQSVISFTNVFYCLPLSIAMASTIAVAYELGAGRKQEAIQYSYISRILAHCIGYHDLYILRLLIWTLLQISLQMMMKYTAYLQLPWIRCILLCYRCHWNPFTRYIESL